MNYKAVYDYCHDISQNLDLSVKFFHGRKEWSNFTDQDSPLYVLMLPLTSSFSFVNQPPTFSETWAINIIIYMQDEESSAIDQNDQDTLQKEMENLTITEKASERFIRLFNANTITDDLEEASDKLTIVSGTKAAAIKDTALQLTGIAMTINVQVPDDFDYCCL